MFFSLGFFCMPLLYTVITQKYHEVFVKFLHACKTVCSYNAGADLGGGCRGCVPLPEMAFGFYNITSMLQHLFTSPVSYVIP